MEFNSCPSSNYCAYHLEVATELARFGDRQDTLIAEIKEIHSLLMRLAVVEKNIIILDDESKQLKQEQEIIKNKLNSMEIRIESIYKIATFIGVVIGGITTAILPYFIQYLF